MALKVKQRITYFDQMKGVAILLVVIGHLMQFSFGYETSHPVKFLYFHMPLFFYISGFLAYKQTSSVRELSTRLAKRSLTILLPYVLFLSIWCVFSGYTNIHDILLGGGGRYWFLYTLFIISSFFLIYEYVIGRVEKTWIYVTLWIIPYVILIVIKIHFTLLGGGDLCNIITGFVNYYRYFLIGYMCRKYLNLYKLLFCNEMVAAVGLMAYLLNWYFFDSHNMLLIFGGSLGAMIVIQRFFQKTVKEDSGVGRAFASIGKQSLAIYVIHYFFIPDVSALMHDFLDCPNPFIWQLTFAFLLSIPIIASCMFVGRLIETNRFLNFMCFGKPFWHEK